MACQNACRTPWIFVAALTTALGLAPSEVAVAADPSAVAPDDISSITKLRWSAPNGELPGTYAEYLAQHPLEPARFAGPQVCSPPFDGPDGRGNETISLLVDADLYPSIVSALDQYVVDLTAEGYTVYTETLSGGSAAEVKSWVRQRFAEGSTGIVFIGDITAAWAEVSEAEFPCDLFYMDLDGEWQDADGDGDYEIHTAGSGDEGPEVYVARIYAHTLDYDSEANLVSQYLSKAHAYRTGVLKQPWQGLEYIDEDWFTMDVGLADIFGDDVVRHDFGYFTTGADYLDQLDLGQHFVQVCVHSWSGGHAFGSKPTESAAYAHVYVYSPSAREARLMIGADDGIRAWFNGELVIARDVYETWTPNRYRAVVTLDEGWNQLLCKVSQFGGNYQLSAWITDMDYHSFPDLVYQVNDPAIYAPEPDFVRGWLLNGFHQDSSGRFWSYLTTNYLRTDEAALNPREGDVHGGMAWAGFTAGHTCVDLAEYSGGADYGACYAFARVYAEADTDCQLWLGYDDGVRVWLNGEVVLYDNRCGTLEPDMTPIDVTLRAGENRLLVKVSQWMGAYGFGARFAHADGSAVAGLSYDPAPEPVSYIGTWLLNGPYANGDSTTRLLRDYLGGEADVRPSDGDPAAMDTWERAIGDGYPFDLREFYNHGDSVVSQDIQDRDPPVLFYNLFACGPGRFTEANYLAGSYIFNTSYGLNTVASAKSGSMLHFHDFTRPLAERKTIGAAYFDWFEAQAPFELGEREWFYGMVLNGDPTLRPARLGDVDHDGDADLSDLAALLAGYNACAGEPAYVPAADFNDDGCVDLSDLAALLGVYTGSR